MFGMTKSEAQKRGNELLSKMKGNGWKLHVWENIGWHYCVSSNLIHVHPFTMNSNKYHCLFGTEGGGLGVWTSPYTELFDDPNDAVEYELLLARKELNKLEKIVENGESVIK